MANIPATVALQKVQATQVYAGLNLWPAATTARLVQAHLAEDGTYPNASAVFGEGGGLEVGDAQSVKDIPVAPLGSLSSGAGLPHYVNEPRDRHGRWTTGEALLPKPSGADLVQNVGIAEDLEDVGGGPPRFRVTPKGAKQFLFPNGMIFRFDLELGQYIAPGQGPHINLEEPNGGPNHHMPLQGGGGGGGSLNIFGPQGGGGGRLPPNELLEE